MPPKKQLKNKVKSESSTELEDSSSDEEIIKNKSIPKKPTKVVKTESSKPDKSDSSKSNDNTNGFKIEEIKSNKFIDVEINNYNETIIDTLIKIKDENKMKIYYNKLIHQNEDDKLNIDGIMWQKDSPTSVSLKYQGKIYIHFRSNKKLIEQLTKICELKRAITNFERHEDKGYYKVLKFYDDEKSCITVTQASPQNAFRRNLLYRLYEPERSNLLMEFNDLENLKCDVVTYYIGNFINYKIEDRKELTRIKDLYSDKDKIKSSNKTDKNNTKLDKKDNASTNNAFFNVEYYKDKLDKIILDLDQDKIKMFKKRLFYIYRIESKAKKQNNFYIFGSTKKYLTKDVNKLINDNYLSIFNDKCSLIELEKIEIMFEVEGQLKVDEYIEKENSLQLGLNLFFNVVLSNDIVTTENVYSRLNLLLNDEIMLELTSNIRVANPEHYYIACIQTPNNYRYVFYEKNVSIQNVIHKLYNSLDENTKIMKVLSTTSFFDLKIFIIQDGILDGDIDIVYNQLIKKLNKNQLLNNFIDDKSDGKMDEKTVDYKKMYFIQKNMYKKRT